MTFPIEDEPGVYIIRCRANNATYCGSSVHLRTRLEAHVSLLRRGICLVALLQRDWNTFGEGQFEFLACHRPSSELYFLEEQLTLLSDSMDDNGGYNKMLSNRVWSLSSRIKNSEQKLIKKRKLSPLPGHFGKQRLTSAYMRTFCQGSTPFFKSEPLLLTTAMDPAEKHLQLQAQLAKYSRFEPAGPLSPSLRLTLHG